MDHNNVALTVSPNEAARVDDEAKRRLLAAKKLSLVVDLDQTIIHATVDNTVGRWQGEEDNPNHEAVKDVQSFILRDDIPRRDTSGTTYYIKMRPGLKDFLENVAQIYEMHIYTMGTRQYAKNIAKIIDPTRKIFGDRILSRDESGSMTAKNLQRLFPVDTKMVVIIDDRGDVWKWSPNLIKVTPYDFFVGIGDINSSFLPKQQQLNTAEETSSAPPPAPPVPPQEVTDPISSTLENTQATHSNGTDESILSLETSNGLDTNVEVEASPLDQLIAMSGGDGTANLDEQTSSQNKVLTAQLEEQPLLQKQRQLEADDAAVVGPDAVSDEDKDLNGFMEDSAEVDRLRPKPSLLQDNDRELYQLEESLRSVHTAFFKARKQRLAAAQGGRLGKLAGGQKQKAPTDKSDLDLVPDIKDILPAVKSRVLGGTVLVFSGIVPIGMDVATTDIAMLAKSFGAVIHDDVSRSTTHVVAARNRTQKVRAAIRRGKGRIRIVSPQWLLESIGSWQRKDERAYLLDIEENGSRSFHEDDILSENETDVSDLDEISDSDSGKSRERPSLSISTRPAQAEAGDEEESDAEGHIPSELEVDDKSPVGGTNEDWNAMKDELEDFLGFKVEDVDEDEENDADDDAANDSEASTISKASARGRKRSRREQDESDSGSDRSLSRQRKKFAVGGRKVNQSSLSQTTTLENGGHQNGNGYESGAAVKTTQRGGGEDENDNVKDEEPIEGDGWSEFGDEDFEAEFERATSEEQQQRQQPPIEEHKA